VLHPLADIGKTARTIALATARGTRIGTLSPRVPRPHGRDELTHLVDTINEMLASLESATQVQRRFVADASHELRAPLTTIQGNLAFLQRHLDELPPEERRTMLVDAHAETLRLARLVDDLLSLARADASANEGQSALTTIALSPESAAEHGDHGQVAEVDRAILQLVRQLRGRLRSEGSPLALEIERIVPSRVHGEEETIRRIVLILLDNAIKYTSPNGGESTNRIRVSLEQTEGHAVLRVRDSGIGIASADLPHIFERFYRADRARGRQGTGLGLSIAAMLVEQLGGHISVESESGCGSTFSVWLPMA
jgi:signal transduction histidine kinase